MLAAVLSEGTPLPAFKATDHQEQLVSSEDWRGRWTVLWWYIKADTPG